MPVPGASIMVSEFIEEKDGYLALSDEQYEYEVANGDEHIDKSACAILEIGEQGNNLVFALVAPLKKPFLVPTSSLRLNGQLSFLPPQS